MAKLGLKKVFNPVVITLETKEELETFKKILNEVLKKSCNTSGPSEVKLALELLQAEYTIKRPTRGL